MHTPYLRDTADFADTNQNNRVSLFHDPFRPARKRGVVAEKGTLFSGHTPFRHRPEKGRETGKSSLFELCQQSWLCQRHARMRVCAAGRGPVTLEKDIQPIGSRAGARLTRAGIIAKDPSPNGDCLK